MVPAGLGVRAIGCLVNFEPEAAEPSAWSSFIKYKDRVSATEFAKGAQYRARFKLATGFRNLLLSDVSPATAESYFVLIKLSLAYSAIEAVEALVGRNSVQVLDDEFHRALELGHFERFLKHLMLAASSQARPTDLELIDFSSGAVPKNLRPLVKHSRHVVFHASVTPSSLKLQNSPERRRLLLGLANATLDSCEQAFKRYVASVRQRPRA